jgi:hypothetical protein
VNFTENAMLCPAGTLAGKASPLIENAVLLTSAFETVTVLPPVLVTVSERLAWLPTWALPNASVVGLDATEPLFPGLGFPASPWQPAKNRASRTTGMTLAQSHVRPKMTTTTRPQLDHLLVLGGESVALKRH